MTPIAQQYLHKPTLWWHAPETYLWFLWDLIVPPFSWRISWPIVGPADFAAPNPCWCHRAQLLILFVLLYLEILSLRRTCLGILEDYIVFDQREIYAAISSIWFCTLMSCNYCSQAHYSPTNLASSSDSWVQSFDFSALAFRSGHWWYCLLKQIGVCALVLCLIRKCAAEAWIETVMAPAEKTLNHKRNLIFFRSCRQSLSYYCHRWTSGFLVLRCIPHRHHLAL